MVHDIDHSSVLISGASDSALNSLCTNLSWQTTSTFACTIAPDSRVRNTSLLQRQPRHFRLTPLVFLSTLTISVRLLKCSTSRNNSVSPPTIDGTFTVEPNVIPMASGDWLEETHHYSQSVNGQFNSLWIQNPYSVFSGSVTEEAQGLECVAAAPR